MNRSIPSLSALHQRWLSHSIRELTPPGMNPVETARWLVHARCALYALAQLRRQH